MADNGTKSNFSSMLKNTTPKKMDDEESSSLFDVFIDLATKKKAERAALAKKLAREKAEKAKSKKSRIDEANETLTINDLEEDD